MSAVANGIIEQAGKCFFEERIRVETDSFYVTFHLDSTEVEVGFGQEKNFGNIPPFRLLIPEALVFPDKVDLLPGPVYRSIQFVEISLESGIFHHLFEDLCVAALDRGAG